MKRLSLPYVLPVLLLLGWIVFPLVSGERTLILRDVLQTHLVDRAALGDSLRRGEIPLVDPLRAGGQALAGNLNALPFYPDNLLLLAGSGARTTLWALNAHFWLHWFVALAAAFWMGRAFGLQAPAAWMGATIYALSGYFVSQMNLYNTIVAAALAPALVAAVLETAPGKARSVRRRGLLAAGIVWALLLVGGEPLLALLGLGLAASALVAVAGWRAFSGRLALALGAGSLLAAPQIVEMARILPLSFRNNALFGQPQSIVGSFRWAHLADVFFPFFFGRPSLGEVLAPDRFDGYPPLLYSLYPGLIALALAVVGAGRAFRTREAGTEQSSDVAPRSSGPARAAAWGLGAIAVALFFALGRFNPIVDSVWALPLGRLLRFPAKFWLPGAVGASLLAGLGFELVREQGRRRLLRIVGAFTIAFVAVLAISLVAREGFARVVGGVLSPELPAATLARELVRLQGLSLLSVGSLLIALALLRFGQRGPGLSGFAVSGLLWLHAATQVWAMLPGLPMDESALYLEAPPILAAIPAGSVVVHGANLDLFRPSTMTRGTYPDGRLLWLTRRSARELYPFAALLHGLRVELAVSPEGLDSFLTQAITVGLKNFSDVRRLDLLSVLGVDYLLLDRELAVDAREQAREISRDENFGQTVHLYELNRRAGEVEFATEVVRAPQMNAALAAVFDPAFDPHRTVVIPADAVAAGFFLPKAPEAPASPRAQAGEVAGSGVARLIENERESVVVETDSPVAGVLSLRRAFLPLWRVRIDGREASTLIAQIAHLGVAVPAGRHRVDFSIDRRPLWASSALAGLGALVLAMLGFRQRDVGESGAGGTIPLQETRET
ncbi:MAG: hypothetical protein ABI639_04965 [Thermoanaerobaculia bacterium]